MRRVFNSSVRGVAAVVMMLAMAGGTFAGPRDVPDKGRERDRGQGIVKIIKKLVRALGDGLTVPLP